MKSHYYHCKAKAATWKTPSIRDLDSFWQWVYAFGGGGKSRKGSQKDTPGWRHDWRNVNFVYISTVTARHFLQIELTVLLKRNPRDWSKHIWSATCEKVWEISCKLVNARHRSWNCESQDKVVNGSYCISSNNSQGHFFFFFTPKGGNYSREGNYFKIILFTGSLP